MNPATEEGHCTRTAVRTGRRGSRGPNGTREHSQSWSSTPVPRRAPILFRYQQLLVEHWEELARLVTLENGKSYAEALRGSYSGALNVSNSRRGTPRSDDGQAAARYRHRAGIEACIGTQSALWGESPLQLPNDGHRAGCSRWRLRAGIPICPETLRANTAARRAAWLSCSRKLGLPDGVYSTSFTVRMTS